MKLPADRNIVKAAALCALVVGGVAVAAPPNGPAADYPVVVGAPYQAGGATFTPADTMNYDIVGYASASAGDSAGEGVSAAHHTLPVPSYVEVTDLASGRTILVRITSRGPMDGANAIALSPAAMAQLGLVAGGPQVAVRVRRVNPPEAERALLRAGAAAPERMPTPAPLLAVLKRRLLPGETVSLYGPAPKAAAQAVLPPVAKPVVAPVVAKEKAPAPQPAAGPSPPPHRDVPANPPPKPAPPAQNAAQKTGEKPAQGTLVVQVGAFSTEAHARAAARPISGSVSASGKFWRVRMGPFATRGEAEAALGKARAAGYSEARIQRVD